MKNKKNRSNKNKKSSSKVKKLNINQEESSLFSNELENLKDEELIDLAKSGNKEATKILIKRYSKFLFSKVIPFYIPGGEKEDIIQEAYIGFLKAIKDFDKTKGNFLKFANICVQRQITTAIKMSNRNKTKVLKNPISLEQNIFDDDSSEKSLYNYISPSKIIQGSNEEISIEDSIIDFMEKNRIKENLFSKLTAREKEILNYRAQGLSYSEIAKKTNLTVKSVDNTIQRIKKKIKSLIEGNLLGGDL